MTVEAGAVRRVLAGAGRTLGAVRRYLGELLGEGAYERYVAAHARAHPGEPPTPEREWWRQQTRAEDRAGPVRCC